MLRPRLRDLFILVALASVLARVAGAETPAASSDLSEIRARLDLANAAYLAGRLAEVESIAVDVRSALEASTVPDSLLLAEACSRPKHPASGLLSSRRDRIDSTPL